MGESKRRRDAETPQERLARELTHKLMDEGKIVEAGWAGLRVLWLHPDSPPHQVEALRWAFMAGAQHLFSSINVGLDEGEEPTDRDLKRFDLIAAELQRFAEEIKLGMRPPAGSA